MRLLTFRHGGAIRIGVLRTDDEVVELAEPADMLSLIDAGDAGLDDARDAVASRSSKTHRLEDVEVLAPLPAPRGNVIAIGRNYQAHAEESARAAGKAVDPPTVFTKAVTTVAGPYDDVVIDPGLSTQVDWEVELGVIVGRRMRNVAAGAALHHVFGYTVGNDVSARDVQFSESQWTRGKSFDTFCPVGPVVVTPDEIPDPQALALRTRVNGEVVQDSSTAEMLFGVAELLAFCSRSFTLEPGDLLLTGTPWGCGYFMDPPRALQVGDVVECEVEHIGVLRNAVSAR